MLEVVCLFCVGCVVSIFGFLFFVFVLVFRRVFLGVVEGRLVFSGEENLYF